MDMYNMIKNILIITFFIILNGCSNDDSTVFNDCQLLKYEEVITKGRSEMNYKHELIYSENKIIKRVNYDFVTSSSGYTLFQEVSRDSIIYDDLGRTYRIYKTLPFQNNYNLYEFVYESSNSLPIKILKSNISTVATYTTHLNLFYSNNKIFKSIETVDEFNPLFYGEVTTLYEYNPNGNLSKIEREEVNDNSGDINKMITEYMDYDEQNNPYLTFPFLEYFGISNSSNNYRTQNVTYYHNGNEYSSEQFSWTYEYNEFGYPLIGIYNCN